MRAIVDIIGCEVIDSRGNPTVECDVLLEDATIAGTAVGTNALQIKTGSMSRLDHTPKYKQLLRLEKGLDGCTAYPGRTAFPFVR